MESMNVIVLLKFARAGSYPWIFWFLSLIRFAPTKTELPYKYYFIKFSPSHTVGDVDVPQTLLRAPWPLMLGLGGQDLTKLNTGKVHTIFVL